MHLKMKKLRNEKMQQFYLANRDFFDAAQVGEDRTRRLIAEKLAERSPLPLKNDTAFYIDERAALKSLKGRGGIYFLHGLEDDLLYVGRSSNIHKRLYHHFVTDDDNLADLKHHVLWVSIFFWEDVKWQELLERALILYESPPFNQKLTGHYGVDESYLSTYGLLVKKFRENKRRKRPIKSTTSMTKPRWSPSFVEERGLFK